MQSSFKKLGDYIRQVDRRNGDGILGENNLYGISVTKEFIISHANLVGVSFNNYKVVGSRQFAYIPDTSRRGDKIAISLNSFGEEIIVSSICTVFEVSDETRLLPEYLMLWFMRPEFDRYARFMSNGSAREVFDWDCMCGVELPVPPIEEQRKIVRDYQVIADRIVLLQKINENIEAQLSAAFLKRFEPLSFESSGEYSLNDFMSFDNGYAFSSDDYCQIGQYRIITIGNVGDGYVDTTKVNYISDVPEKVIKNVELFIGDIVISLTGNVGRTAMIKENGLLLNQRVARIVPKDKMYHPFLYCLFRQQKTKSYLEGISKGTAQLNLSPIELLATKVDYQATDIISFYFVSLPCLKAIVDVSKEIALLTSLQTACLSSISKKGE